MRPKVCGHNTLPSIRGCRDSYFKTMGLDPLLPPPENVIQYVYITYIYVMGYFLKLDGYLRPQGCTKTCENINMVHYETTLVYLDCRVLAFPLVKVLECNF